MNNDRLRDKIMMRLRNIKPAILLLLLTGMGLVHAAAVWGYDRPGLDLRLYTDPAHPGVTYQLGTEPIPLIMVQRNVALADVATKRGFTERQLYRFLIVTDPSGRRHYLNAGVPAHRMPMPFFIANRAWGKAESIPREWQRSVLIDDMRDLIAEMNTLAGWYTFQVQQPFVRYASLREDASLGVLADLLDPNNWKGTLTSNVVQIYVAPTAGARLNTLVKKLENDVESPLAQIAVRVFSSASLPANAEPETVWSTGTPVLTGTTNSEGVVVWSAASVCLNRDDYLVLVRYGGEYQEEPIDADDDQVWAAECQGSIAQTIVFEPAPPAVPGDLSGDGVIDTTDYNIFRSTLGKCVGTDGFIPDADYDQDGCVTYQDYRVWLEYYRNQ